MRKARVRVSRDVEIVPHTGHVMGFLRIVKVIDEETNEVVYSTVERMDQYTSEEDLIETAKKQAERLNPELEF